MRRATILLALFVGALIAILVAFRPLPVQMSTPVVPEPAVSTATSRWTFEPFSEADVCHLVSVGFDPLSEMAAIACFPQYHHIGLGGSVHSYTRPFQHLQYYEIDEAIRKLDLSPTKVDSIPRIRQ